MAQHVVHTQLPGQLVMLGCGSIGQAVLPLILRHLGVTPDRITIVTADGRGRDEAAEYGIAFHETALTQDELSPRCSSRWSASATSSSTCRSMSAAPPSSRFAHERGALYLDTVVEPWGGVYFDRSLSPAARSNYALREEHAAAAPRARPRPDRGQRPGCQPRPGLAARQGGGADRRPRHRPGRTPSPPTAQGWARLFRDLGVKAIHIAERDTQVSAEPKRPGEFVNTWSIDGFVSEGCQPAELGWGTHERHFPQAAACATPMAAARRST